MEPEDGSNQDAEIAEDLDAEGVEEDEDAEEETHKGGSEEDDGSDADAEVADEDDDDDEGEVVGAVKTRRNRTRRKPAEDDEEEEEGYDEGDNDDSDDESAKSAEDGWEAANEDDDEEDVEAKNASANRCVFCGQDEDHDPAEDFEEYLACSVCGDNAHMGCARDAGSLAPDEDTSTWRCKDCVLHGLEADFKDVPKMLSSSRRRSSAPRMARDLLPAARGGIKPDSHSVFNTLILDEDPMDGSRSLRKRKTPSGEDEDRSRATSSKRRRADMDREASAAATGDLAVDGVDGGDDADSARSQSGRPHRQSKPRQKSVRIVRRSDDPKSLVMAFAVTAAQWDQIEREVQKKQRRRERDRLRRARNSRRTATIEPEENNHFPAIQTTIYNNPFYAFPDRETDEAKGKPYGGILTDAEADTTRTYPLDVDRQAFQDARTKAERALKEKLAAQVGETPARSKSSGPPSKIKSINFGQYEIDTWHAAPYPEEYSRNKHLYICEFCLKYMSTDYVAWRHKLKCSAKCPPGDEIYRSKAINPETGAETTLSFFEVDGRRNPLYCQNLCLLAKLFLGSKTLYYDVEPFLFYIMTENDEFGCHFVGYFSKEKRGCGPLPPITTQTAFDDPHNGQAGVGADAQDSAAFDPALSNPGNNVSCILVLPVHMRRGFGRVLIEFSYLLTKVEGRTGSPEKPLSDMGLVSYRSYWRHVLCALLLRYRDKAGISHEGELSIVQIARETGMTPDDIISTLESLRFLVRDPVTRHYALRLDYEYMQEYVDKHEKKAHIKLDPDKLCWTPYVMGKPSNYFAMGEEANQPLQTVAPREEIDAPLDEPDGLRSAIDTAAGVPATSAAQHDEATETTETVDLPILVNGFSNNRHNKSSPPHFALTPEPSILVDTKRSNHSPLRHSSRKTPNGVTRSASPAAAAASPYDHEDSDSQTHPSSTAPIPPTRYEVFPPVPGMAFAKRRPGRPFKNGSGRRSGNGTPSSRRALSARRNHHGDGGGSTRRTRSTLGDVAFSAEDVDVGADKGTAKEDDEEVEEEENGDDDAEGVPEDDEDDAEEAEEDDEDDEDEDEEIRYE